MAIKSFSVFLEGSEQKPKGPRGRPKKDRSNEAPKVKGVRGRPKGTNKDDNEPEGTQPVFAFVVLTDTGSNRFFLNKAKNAFIKYNPKDVYAVKLGTAAELEGKSKGQLKPAKDKILNALPQEIGKYDIYEDDIAVMDQFELQGAPAALYGSDHSMEDEG
jgi:hypothetical protein